MNGKVSLAEVIKAFAAIEGEDALVTDSKMTAYLLDHCEIIFTPENRFFCLTDVAEPNMVAQNVIRERFRTEFESLKEELPEQAMKAQAFQMFIDFGHTSPNWKEILDLGFVGLRKRAENYAAKEEEPSKKRFYEAVVRVYDASERFIHRVIDKALAEGRMEIAQSLKKLLTAAPQTMYEAMQMLFLYYTLQHSAEGTLIRTFGRVDQFLYPFYCQMDQKEAALLVRDFITELNSHRIRANQPFSLGGTDKDGKDQINALSYVFLDAYKELNPDRVKIHILCSDHMPEAFLKSAMAGVRDGANSLMFMGDSTIKKSLLRMGIQEEDVTDYHVDGCYECGGFGELTSPTTARINIAKAVELALNNGQDVLTGYQIGLPVTEKAQTFEAFYQEFLRQLSYICDYTKHYSYQMETLYPRLHAGPLFSSTYPLYMENGKDVYTDFGAKYNNTSIVGSGLATAVDSLMSVKKIVYDDKRMSLQALNELMKNNWEGQEVLRTTVRNKFPKFGMGDREVDQYASDIVDFLARQINHVPNAKNGIYRLGMFSIDWRWEFGEGLAATPDGRLAGETISLNAGASFGADREGATAHILSVTAVDATQTPTATVLDLDMHYSAVKGQNGLKALCATLKTFLDNGGFAVHYNILNADVLSQAQKTPEDFPNLQVRVCGWNSLFSHLSKKEQDEYIARAQSE